MPCSGRAKFNSRERAQVLNEKLIDQIVGHDNNEPDRDHERDHPAITRLIELGRKQGYVTIDDILNFFPEAERDVDKLEEAFAALLGAGIAYVDDPELIEPSETELNLDEEDVEDEKEFKRLQEADDNYLANIDTDDMIGLYLKEVDGWLLNPENEDEGDAAWTSVLEENYWNPEWPMPLRMRLEWEPTNPPFGLTVVCTADSNEQLVHLLMHNRFDEIVAGMRTIIEDFVNRKVQEILQLSH